MTPVRIAHISDTHFGTEVPAVMAALHRDLHAQKPDIIVLSGDITQRARKSQFVAAAAFLQSLPAPVLMVPGNHDLPLYDVTRRFLTPLHYYTRYCGEAEWLWQGHGMAIIGFNATSPYLHTRGRLDPGQCARKLAAARSVIGSDTPLLAVIHQPLIVALASDEDERLINHAGVAACLAEYKVAAVLSGHVHVPFISKLEAHYPGIANLPLHCGAGTVFSHRIRPGASNSYNILTVTDKSVSAQVIHYSADHDCFAPYVA